MNGEAPDVIALGETMLSLVARDGSLGTASEFVATHGGAETNALVTLAAAGFRTAWVSRLGKDEAGQRIRRELNQAGVDLRWVVTDPERPTGLMLRDTVGTVRYWRSGSAASELTPRDLDEVPVGDARAVLVSGITAMLGPGPQAAAISFLDGARGLRAVDPNLRPGLWGSSRGRDLIVPLMERCDVVLGGEGELATLMGGGDARESARRCAELGPSEVVVKRGGRGAAMLDPDGVWHEIRQQTVEEIDPVGAGDAFNAAYLGTRLSGGSCVEALQTAAGAGAVAAGSLGDAVSGGDTHA